MEVNMRLDDFVVLLDLILINLGQSIFHLLSKRSIGTSFQRLRFRGLLRERPGEHELLEQATRLVHDGSLEFPLGSVGS